MAKQKEQLRQVCLPNGETVFAIIHRDGSLTPLRGCINWKDARAQYQSMRSA